MNQVNVVESIRMGQAALDQTTWVGMVEDMLWELRVPSHEKEPVLQLVDLLPAINCRCQEGVRRG